MWNNHPRRYNGYRILGISNRTKKMTNVQRVISRRGLIAGATTGLALVASQRFVGGVTPPQEHHGDGGDGWTTASPREEIRPEFSVEPHGGPERRSCLVIRA